MPSLIATRAANSAYSFPKRPVAVFIGGTSGIGQATAQALARYTKGNADIIICGRSQTAADSIIASFPKPSSHDGTAPLHEFVPCDVFLMKNVHQTTGSLLNRLPKINYLFISAGLISMKGRDETEEGIDKKLAAHYYSRWTFINDLVPLLKKAEDAGEDAKVVTVLGTGSSGQIDMNDLGLKRNYSVANAGLAAQTYNDLMIEEFASRYPGMTFTHVSPGAVRTPLLARSHWAMRPLSALFLALLYPLTVSQEDCAEYMLYSLLKGKNGAFRRGQNGDDVGKTAYSGSLDARERLWNHTVEATTVSLSMFYYIPKYSARFIFVAHLYL